MRPGIEWLRALSRCCVRRAVSTIIHHWFCMIYHDLCEASSCWWRSVWNWQKAAEFCFFLDLFLIIGAIVATELFRVAPEAMALRRKELQVLSEAAKVLQGAAEVQQWIAKICESCCVQVGASPNGVRACPFSSLANQAQRGPGSTALVREEFKVCQSLYLPPTHTH